MEYSAAPSGMRSRRASSRSACSSASCGIFASAIDFLRSSTSAPVPAAFAEFLLNLVQSLAQHRLLLALVEGLARALIDLPRDLQYLDPPVEERKNPVEPRFELESRQNFLFLGWI